LSAIVLSCNVNPLTEMPVPAFPETTAFEIDNPLPEMPLPAFPETTAFEINKPEPDPLA